MDVGRNLDMEHRKDDDIVPKILRVVDWKWFLGICGIVVIWAISQWVNYNALLKEFEVLSKNFTSLTLKIDGVSEQLTNLKIVDLKHESEIARLKDQVSDIQAWKQSLQNGKQR